MSKGRRRKSRPRGAIALAAIVAASAGALIICALIIHAERKLSTLVLGGLGEAFPTKIYSAPLIIQEGSFISPHRLMRRLDRLGYQTVPAPEHPGEFSWQDPVFTIYLRGFDLPHIKEKPRLVSLDLGDQNQWRLHESNDGEAFQVALDPLLLTDVSGAEKIRRDPAEWRDFPQYLIRAVISAEDKRFFDHWGVDPKALLRASWRNIKNPGHLQGGSTITQQLAKNLLLTPKRTLWRKLAEAALSVYLELRLSKEEILTLYLNHIYLGQDGATSVTGVKAAAELYFGKPLPALTTSEAALLAGLIRSPYRYNPFRDPEESLKRRRHILRLMRQNGYLTGGQERLHDQEPLRLRQAPSKETSIFSYYLAEVLRDLSKKYPEGDLMRLGFRIYTAMDPDLQETLGRAAGLTRHQAALIALDPASGYILALVGGRDFSKSQFNRATQAKRQPGSAFKPLVYAAALEQGWTPASTVLDEQRSLKQLKKTAWEPKNFDGVYHGTVTLRQALSLSLNAATVELSQKVGLAGIVQMARRLGIESLLKEYPALALGTFEVSLVEITAAYAPFANGGWSIHPTLIMAMLDSNGATLEFSPVRRSPALDPASANLMTSLLESAVTEGTGRGLAKMGWDRKAAGKTGTTDEGRDAWFIGYTPELLCGVWVGDDEHRAINVSGAKDALPLWAAFMKEALAEYPPSDFATPEGLVSVVIDPLSGLLATGDCPERKKELFAAGTEPTAKCPLHRKDNLFDRLRQWWKK